MTSPVSIGDAVLLAKLALKLGRAFTTGRKSAPAEFREVESQLYSISTALSSLETAYKATKFGLVPGDPRRVSLPQNRQDDGNDAVESILQGCGGSLKHLEAVVNKYSTISQPRPDGRSSVSKWTGELKKNWKKVQWTTEGGDLVTLRSQLTVHINCLNLVIGVISHTQADRVESQVDKVTIMLQDIYTWFLDNIQGHTTESPQFHRVDTSTLVGLPVISIRFELCSSSTGGETLCSNASLHPKWEIRRQGSGEGETLDQVFQCNCIAQPGQSTPHTLTLATLGLSPFSFALRLTGSTKMWMIYKASNRANNRLVSLIIKNVPVTRINEFEKSFIDVLAVKNAKSMLLRDMGTMLAYTTPSSSDGTSETRILNMMGDLQLSQKQVEKVTFTVGRQSYSRTTIDTIQLLHYKTLSKEIVSGDLITYSEDLKSMNTAELVIFYMTSSSRSDISRVILHLTHNMTIRYRPGESSVLICSIDCTGMDPDNREDIIYGVDVSVQLASPQVAVDFKNKIREMRVELFVMSLRAPRSDETLALILQVGGVHTEELDLPDSELSIVQSETSGRLRLIIVSNDGTTILSQEMPKDILTAAGGRPSFRSPTYVVQITGNGTRDVRLFDKGFEFLDFTNMQMDRLFGLGLAAVSGKLTN